MSTDKLMLLCCGVEEDSYLLLYFDVEEDF